MKKINLTIVLLLIINILQGQIIEKKYHFSKPIITEKIGYQQISFEGCLLSGVDGEPALPWQSVSLLLPEGTEANDMEVLYSNFVELEGTYNLFPYQRPLPVSKSEEFSFSKNETLYQSRSIYPSTTDGKLKNQYLNGYAFAFAGFTPLRYVPATGKVAYAQDVTVRIKTHSSRDDHSTMFHHSKEIENKVKSLAQNFDETLPSYQRRDIDDSSYDLLVITTAEWVEPFGEYKAFYEERGLRVRIKAIEEIVQEIQEGRDTQEKIRLFIRKEYQEEGISMVCLGGDVAIVPYRSLWVLSWEGGEADHLPADCYYSNLDGTWNDDDDDKWGEPGEDDLLPEVAIGRIPFNNQQQFDNLMHKTFSYQQSPVLGEFRTIALGAEWLSDGYSGSNDLKKLLGECTDAGYTTYGIDANYFDINYLWAEYGQWSCSNLTAAMNAGLGYVHHCGHANTQYLAGWENGTISSTTFAGANGRDHNYVFLHSHGCICGDFSHDCVMEKLVTMSTGCVAVTGNSRYGWYEPYGDGPGVHLNRELVDAYYHEGLPYLGTAFQEMKIQTAPWIGLPGQEDDCLRWNFYDINILGDVAICPFLDEPYVPEVKYEPVLSQGITETTVQVLKENVPQRNFRCSLFHGDERIAYGYTDATGFATLHFTQPLSVSDDLRLIITGPNAFPSTIKIESITDEPLLFVKNFSFSTENQRLSYNDEITLSCVVKNPSEFDISNATLSLSSTSEEIEILNGSYNLSTINAQQEINLDDVLKFKISDDIVDGTLVDFTLKISSRDFEWTQDFLRLVHAPKFIISDCSYIDEDENYCVEPGEEVTFFCSTDNDGSASCSRVEITISCNSPYVSFDKEDFVVNNFTPEHHETSSLDFFVSPEAPEATIIDIEVEVKGGKYVDKTTFSILVGKVIEEYEDGGFVNIPVYFGGDGDWFVTDSLSYQGQHCVQTGRIGDDQISSMFTDFETTTGGEMSFYLKTATEHRADILAFYIDDIEQQRWSGINDWAQYTFNVAAGRHHLEWRYDKNKKKKTSTDACWIDNLILPVNSRIFEDVEENTISSFTIYPNPTKNSFTITGEKGQQVVIRNINGQEMMSFIFSSNILIINIESLQSGIYFVSIVDNNGVSTQKLIKE